MKRYPASFLLIVPLLGAMLLVCGCEDDDSPTENVTGTWSGSYALLGDQGFTDFTMTLVQSGNTINGTTTLAGGEVLDTCGVISGKENWVVLTPKHDGTVVLEFSGPAAGGLMSGQVRTPGGAMGGWSAERTDA